MKPVTLDLPNRTYEHLKAIALFEEKSLEAYATEILVLAERELWKIQGARTEEMMVGLEYFNKHCR